MLSKISGKILVVVPLLSMWLGCGSGSTPQQMARSQTSRPRPPSQVTAAVPEQIASQPTDERHGNEPSELQQPEMQPAPDPVVQKVYRPSDTRPVHDDVRAAEFGIQKYVSDRLILYSDIDPQLAEPLLGLVDQVYRAWVEEFGDLPPDREGTTWQMTGYLIDNPKSFVAAGMLPEGPPMFRFGRHDGARFWMNDQTSDYYRRHLLVHEATHCFMTFPLRHYPARWYLEGMAEEFGTHVIHPDGTVTFGVMPQETQQFPGLGRIELIQQELVQGRPVSLSRVGTFTQADWDSPRPTPYAWSWALCHFLRHHPRYQERFRELGQHMEGPAFDRYLQEHFSTDRHLLAAEWDQFIRYLEYGADVAGNAFVTHDGSLNPLEEKTARTVTASQGWQSTGLHVEAGSPIRITATGEVRLDQTADGDWISHPQGISIRYAAGFPIGTLLAGILPDSEEGDPFPAFDVLPIGAEKIVTPSRSGELWLRINDAASDLRNNVGDYEVTLEPDGGE